LTRVVGVGEQHRETAVVEPVGGVVDARELDRGT
jgi:hypothetical protein